MSDDDPEATPDELLLELMDLVTLAFPEPLCAMTVSFVEAEDRKRPALSNLDGIAAPVPKGAERLLRPNLGHGDNLVLDAINSLLVDLADATLRQGGVKVLTGRLEMKDGPDGDRFVELMDENDVVMMRRRFDKSELRWLFWTAPLFRALLATEVTERDQRARLETELRAFQSFQIDMTRGEIAFTTKAGTHTEYGIELLGSWADDTKRFLWGWANEQAPDRLKKRVDTIRSSSVDEGLRALTEPSYGCPEPCAERLARHAAARLDALGLYRAPFKSAQAKGFMYLALFAR